MKDFFNINEMRSKDGAVYPTEFVDMGRWSKLLATLNTIREHWGGPIKIVSGYRSPAHNAKVGGAKKSRHMTGEAADLKPMEKSGSARALHAVILALHANGKLPHLGGLGEYNTFTHIDVRANSGRVARWKGKSVT